LVLPLIFVCTSRASYVTIHCPGRVRRARGKYYWQNERALHSVYYWQASNERLILRVRGRLVHTRLIQVGAQRRVAGRRPSASHPRNVWTDKCKHHHRPSKSEAGAQLAPTLTCLGADTSMTSACSGTAERWCITEQVGDVSVIGVGDMSLTFDSAIINTIGTCLGVTRRHRWGISMY
jgi:hypothetical protein